MISGITVHNSESKLWEELGRMLQRAARPEPVEVEWDAATAKLYDWLERKAAGESPADLTPDEIDALAEPDEDEDLPERIIALLKLVPGDTIGTLFESMTCVYFMDEDSGRTARE